VKREQIPVTSASEFKQWIFDEVEKLHETLAVHSDILSRMVAVMEAGAKGTVEVKSVGRNPILRAPAGPKSEVIFRVKDTELVVPLGPGDLYMGRTIKELNFDIYTQEWVINTV
jgi:hypothetical protein